ncbi:MmgE/PrpD family protein [Methylobacterium radiotolerans]|nr:MmgE/PrpD family protein [Methylobacterium radiotolerans]
MSGPARPGSDASRLRHRRPLHEKWHPTTRDTADHGQPYITARAMLDVAIPSASYAQDRLRDPSPLALIDRVTAAEEAALTTTQPERCRTA